MITNARYSLRSEETTATLSGCNVEVANDGTALVIVDGEPLFRFGSLRALLDQYGLLRGDLLVA